ncbi:MAG: hypothetical protein AAF587_34010 [Bacteroidota bacterium]
MSRLVLFDKRGTDLSDPVNEHNLPDIEQRASDLHIIMNAIEIESANFVRNTGKPLVSLTLDRYKQIEIKDPVPLKRKPRYISERME